MKKKHILFATCMIGAFTFSSCEKNLYDESKQPEKEIKMTDLNIPDNFQWKLTQVAKGTTRSNAQTMVSLYLDEKCSEDEKIATIPVYKEDISLPLSIPTYVKTLYAQYQNTTGKKISKPVAVNADGSYALNITDAAEVIPTRAITRGDDDDDYDIEDDINYDKGVVYHPKSGWGTIMFEDQFPSLGDYDFNDFVVNYKAQFKIDKSEDQDYKSNSIVIDLRLKAVGGIYKYIPKLRLKEIKNKNVTSISIYNNNNNKIEVKRTEDKEGDLIIDCSSLIKDLNKQGSQYYNTEKNALIATSDLPQITISIKLTNPEEVDDILENDEFDLYLENEKNETEIHMNGIEPVEYIYPSNNANLLPIYKSNGKIEDDNYYYSKEKLIWGLRVPDNISHAVEGANFLEAYKGFAKWANSGGEDYPNWYNGENINKDVLIYN